MQQYQLVDLTLVSSIYSLSSLEELGLYWMEHALLSSHREHRWELIHLAELHSRQFGEDAQLEPINMTNGKG